MKILICSKLFYPSNDIGAVRPSNFAKYLTKFGHEVTVITEGTHDNEVIGFQNVEILRISNSKTITRIIKRVQNHISAHKPRRKNFGYTLSKNHKNYDWKDIFLNIKKFYKESRLQIFVLIIQIDWFLRAKKTIKRKYPKYSFEIVISSFGPFGSVLLGYSVSKSKIARHWISDIRDNMSNVLNPFWLNKIYKFSERTMACKADAITFVSQGQLQMFCKSMKNTIYDMSKMHVIYNGYEDNFQPEQNLKTDMILRITYTGQLYSNLRNCQLLFKVLNDLIEECQIDPKNIILYYAGQSSVDFNEQLSDYPAVRKTCQDVGFVNKKIVQEKQKESDILVVLTWNSDTYQGVLTGKFMEYIQAYKPIISLTSGNLSNGELTQMIEKLNLGIACEYITYEKDYIRLKEYLLAQYNRKQKEKPLLFEPDIEGMQKFHYEKLTEKLNNLCITLA